MREVPYRTFVPLALLIMFGPLVVMLIDGDPIHPSVSGLAILALLLVGVSRGSAVAWTLLLVWSGFVFLVVLIAIGWPWSFGAVLLLAQSLACALLLLSPSLRRHVRRPISHPHPA